MRLRFTALLRNVVTRQTLVRLGRVLAFCLLAIFCLGWVASLPPFTTARTPLVWHPVQPLLRMLDRPPSWRDALVIHIRIIEPAVQQERGELIWQASQRLGRMPVTVVSDGLAHEVVIPIGTHPDWWGAHEGVIQNLRLAFPHQNELDVDVQTASLLQRSPFALDAMLGRVVALSLPVPPSFKMLVALTALMLAIGLAATWPGRVSHFTRLSVAAAASACLCLAVITPNLVQAVGELPMLWARYGTQSDAALRVLAPHYADSAQINIMLVRAASTLPDGTVAVITRSPVETYLKARANYLLFPRVVTFAQTGEPLYLEGVTSVIQSIGSVAPRLGSGWQRVAQPLTGYEVWRTAGGAMPAVVPVAPFNLNSLIRIVVGLVLVLGVGWGVGAVLHPGCALRLVCSLPLGAGIVALWMLVQSVCGVRWSALSIGLALSATCALLIGYGHLEGRFQSTLSNRPKIVLHVSLSQFVRNITGVERMVVLAVLLLVVLVAAQAVLTPFTDQDTWTTWGFNSRAFFVEGGLQSALSKYGPSDLNHPSYPPLIPLFHAWLFYAMGGVSERLLKLSMPLWYLALVGLTWHACRQWTTPNRAALCALLLATTPLLLDHAALGNADLPFTTMLCAAAVVLTRWIDTGERGNIAAGIVLLCMAAWTKLDGVYLGVLFVLLALVARLRARRTLRPHFDTWHVALFGVVFVVGAHLAWAAFTKVLRIKGETPGMAMLRVTGLANLARGALEAASEMVFSHNNSTWGLLGGEYGLLWVAGFGALVMAWRELRRNPVMIFLASSVVGTILFYVAIYALRPFFSIERYLMHAAPLLVMATACALNAVLPANSAKEPSQ